MNRRKYPIPGKEANPYDCAVCELVHKLVDLASASPLAFAYAVQTYVVNVCTRMHSMQDFDPCLSPSSYFNDVAGMIRCHTKEIEDRFVSESKFVANEFGIKADTIDLEDDDCGF